MKRVNEFRVFLTGLNGWMFVCELCGCGISFHCGYLSVCEMIRIYNQKISCPSTVLLNYFSNSIIKASLILHGGTIPVVPCKNWVKAISIHLIRKLFIWSGKVFCLSSYLLLPDKKNHAYLTDLHYSTWLLKKYSRVQRLSHSGNLL